MFYLCNVFVCFDTLAFCTIKINYLLKKNVILQFVIANGRFRNSQTCIYSVIY